MFVPLTPLHFRERALKLYASRVAVVDGEQRHSYADFGRRTTQLCNALQERGIGEGRRVAYLAFNSHQLLEGYYGVPMAGCVLLPINIRLSPADIAYILVDADVSLLLVDGELHPLLAEIERLVADMPPVLWLGSRPGGRREDEYEELLAAASPLASRAPEIDENATVELFYTSGTTGRPKGVMLSHRALYLHALSVLVAIPGDLSDVQLHTIPLFHVNGWGTPQLLTAVGGRHVMMRRFDPALALKLIEREAVTRLLAVPTMMTMLLAHPDIERRDLSSLRVINMGGAATPPDMIRRAEQAFGCAVFAGYGLSETSPVLTLATDPEPSTDTDRRIARAASTGLPLLGVDLRIVTVDGAELPWNGVESGEIVVRSNTVMNGYWGDEEATSAALRDGWFHTGDIATIDPDGYVQIVDRRKDIIISGGENISSVEIEKVLYNHPDVFEVAVIGIPDTYWGEVPKALVVLTQAASVTQDDLLAFCRDHLASFKVPQSVDFMDALPKGGTGKILKAQLREPFWQDHDTRVH